MKAGKIDPVLPSPPLPTLEARVPLDAADAALTSVGATLNACCGICETRLERCLSCFPSLDNFREWRGLSGPEPSLRCATLPAGPRRELLRR